jgi:hypothetical protein
MSLEPHVSRWWDVANARRGRLIEQKYKGGGLSPRQEAEFTLLQGICGLVMNYAAPIDFSHLEKLTRQAERLAKRVAKASLKAQRMTKKGGKAK